MARKEVDLPAVTQCRVDERYPVPYWDSTISRWLLSLPIGQAWADQWRPFDGTYGDQRGPRATAPSPDYVMDGLVYDHTIAHAVRPIVEPYGEILPLTIDGRPHEFFHCLTTADALDETNSGLLQWDPGTTPRRLGVYWNIALHEDIAERAGIFQIPEKPGTVFYARHIAHALLTTPGWTGSTFEHPY